MKGSILIIDDLHLCFKEEAIRLGYQVDDKPHLSKAETQACIHQYVGIAIRTKFRIDADLLAAATNLQFIARAGAGLDNIDVAAAEARGIKLLAANEGNCDAVGEHTLGMLLSLMNNFRRADMQIRNGIWDREGNRGYELKGKTVGIVGYGFMGQSFARRLSGLGVKVLAYDKYRNDYSDSYAQQASMDELFEQADVLSLHIPLTAETKQMVNDAYLNRFAKPIFFLTTARGEIVNTQAVLNQIEQGKIRGAGLDVLEVEKFPRLAQEVWYKKLIANDKVLLTPHVAGWTFDSYRKISEVLAQKLAALNP
jgi:D-3-phosphoglycerate dehydrogenase